METTLKSLENKLRDLKAFLPMVDRRRGLNWLPPNNLYLYYEVIQAIVLAYVHTLKLVLNVPLKTVNRQHELYKMAVLLKRI